ncbi:hypothetical protein A1F94_011809 [Pyrenophora tritici-repentis]|nr:hypothetical protein A1F94_011809 [Pyrenophora tritici-repentis]KAI0627651.1 hypothetical protein TUN199_00380 [Pyrenophora tritici-repentis]KAI1523873.1 hypothetical protein PtrSN001C_011270 [Pyrenophora tritici-repentis]KAI1572536.1 hypothetical protein PtrEW13061_011267 [Pyrenophora tritici-repentis]KAI1582947.1 hypothetical protein PtrEW7m1_003557 [Pyrenophora tritici-repentis]
MEEGTGPTELHVCHDASHASAYCNFIFRAPMKGPGVIHHILAGPSGMTRVPCEYYKLANPVTMTSRKRNIGLRKRC